MNQLDQEKALSPLIDLAKDNFNEAKRSLPHEIKDVASASAAEIEEAILLFFTERTYLVAKGYSEPQVDAFTSLIGQITMLYCEQRFGIQNDRMSEILSSRLNRYNEVYFANEDNGRWKSVGQEAVVFMKIAIHEHNIRPLKIEDTQLVPEPEEEVASAIKKAVNYLVSTAYSKNGLCGQIESKIFANDLTKELLK